MRLCSIASGSSGNCIYIGSEEHHILIDAGISGKRVEAGLNSLELTGKDLDGILLTHEHSDHIKGLGVLSRKYGVPIYTTPGTVEAVKGMTNLGKIRWKPVPRDSRGRGFYSGGSDHFPVPYLP